MRVLVVEDDLVIAEHLADALRGDGHHVDVAHDGEEGLLQAEIGAHALIVLDIMLPGRDGWSICAALRKQKNPVPILMLTARDSVDDRVRGLEEGADDYLPKPFDVREFLARARALLRRNKLHKSGVISVADLEIDTVSHQATRQGQLLPLTPREYSLLEALARNEGRTLTRAMILETVWGNEECYDNTVSFHVASLRKKVDAAFEQKLIHTVHGIGYVLKSPGPPQVASA
ncbi:MAG: response regulator transcription factor [Fimbriimonas sp.]